MKEINLPPFYVGQKVVYVNDNWNQKARIPTIKKGHEGVVKGIKYMCCHWCIDIGEDSATPTALCTCGMTCYKPNSNFWLGAFRFAPVQENFQSISLEKVLETEIPLISVN